MKPGYIVSCALITTAMAIGNARGAEINPLSSQPAAESSASKEQELLLFWEEKELFVETATRIAKPISQAAENMTVISAKEIEDMGAHTVAEVLNRVPGLYVDLLGSEFMASASISMQGSQKRHVTVLLDGINWNMIAEGAAETFTIPVRIIERIEIIKGPASSAWGSALGGVINIITKGTGEKGMPQGMVSASYGEANSQDYNAELSGKTGAAGYYLYGGRTQSDGLRKNRDSQQSRLYGKLELTPHNDLTLRFTSGFCDPKFNSGDVSGQGVSVSSRINISAFFATGSLEYRITPEWNLSAGAHYLRQHFDSPIRFTTSIPPVVAPGDLFKQIIDNEQTMTGNLKLAYSSGMHNAVLGTELSLAGTDNTANVGTLYQQLAGLPATSTHSPGIDKWAVFTNDTLDLGRLVVTPGLRLDHNNISGYFLSPSLGVTYELAERSVLRASVARGFTPPPLAMSRTAGPFIVANPDLKTETSWSYQLGVETGVADLFNSKATLFRHETEDSISDNYNASRQYTNVGNTVRQGYELELESVPCHNTSLRLAHAYSHTHTDNPPAGNDQGGDNYSWLVGIKYDDRSAWMAQLFGSYIFTDQPSSSKAQLSTFVWDFNASRKLQLGRHLNADLFLALHNIFSAPHYTIDQYPNPNRWVEGGIRFRF